MTTPQFDKLLEGVYPASMKVTKRTIYPREMAFSEEFLESLQREFNRLKMVEENGEQRLVKNLPEKFVKAVDFRVRAFNSAPAEVIAEPEQLTPTENS